MSRKNTAIPTDLAPLRAYKEPWKGQLVLACGKCQKKLKRGGKNGLTSLKKLLKERSQEEPGVRLRVATISCLKLCPKGGVAVCTQAQMGRGECSIVYTKDDVDALYGMVRAVLPDGPAARGAVTS